MNTTQGVFPLICFVHSMIAFLTALTLKKVCTLLGLYCPTTIILTYLARLSFLVAHLVLPGHEWIVRNQRDISFSTRK